MKKTVCMLLAALLLLSLAGCGSSGASAAPDSVIEQIKAKGELVVGTSADYPPYEFHTEIDGKDTIVGFDIAIAQAVADSLGVKLNIVDMSFDNLLMSLANGEFDMVIAGMSSNEEREKAADFSDVYLPSKSIILIRTEDEEKYKDLEDLMGAKGGAQTGAIPYDNCVKYCGAENAVGLTKVQDLVMELQAGKLDVLFLDYMTVLTYAAVKDDLSAVDVNIPSENPGYRIAVKDGNTELTEYLNGIIAQLNAENAIEQFVVEAQQLAGLEE